MLAAALQVAFGSAHSQEKLYWVRWALSWLWQVMETNVREAHKHQM